jgi:hypothetical protein
MSDLTPCPYCGGPAARGYAHRACEAQAAKAAALQLDAEAHSPSEASAGKGSAQNPKSPGGPIDGSQ